MMGKKGSGSTLGLVEAIKSAVPLIVANFNHPTQCERSKQVMADLIIDIETKDAGMERLYLMYQVIEQLEPLTEVDVSKFFSTIFPIPLKKDIATFLSQLVSLSLSLNCSKILTAASIFVAKNQIPFPVQEDVEVLPNELATSSPIFVTTILNKGIISGHELFTPQLIGNWLVDLINNPNITPFNGEALINYTLLGSGVISVESRLISSKLHLKLLELIEKNKIRTLTPQYVIDLAVSITNYDDSQVKDNQVKSSKSTNSVTIPKDEVIERFCQLLFVAFESGIVAKFPNSLKKKMNNLFPNHDLMSAVMKYK